jgi:hypothetical protein
MQPHTRNRLRKTAIALSIFLLFTVGYPVAVDQAWLRYNFYVLPIVLLAAILLSLFGFLHSDFAFKHLGWFVQREGALLSLTVFMVVGAGLGTAIGASYYWILDISKTHIAALLSHETKSGDESTKPSKSGNNIPAEVILPILRDQEQQNKIANWPYGAAGADYPVSLAKFFTFDFTEATSQHGLDGQDRFFLYYMLKHDRELRNLQELNDWYYKEFPGMSGNPVLQSMDKLKNLQLIESLETPFHVKLKEPWYSRYRDKQIPDGLSTPPKDKVIGLSLKQRTLLLANDLDKFDQTKRNQSWHNGILGREEEVDTREKSASFDNQTIKEFRTKFRRRITDTRNEFDAKGLNVMNVPTVDEYLKNWNWNGKNHGASKIAAEFSQYLRGLAGQIDEQGNLIR